MLVALAAAAFAVALFGSFKGYLRIDEARLMRTIKAESRFEARKRAVVSRNVNGW